jgi:hypothetical protein
MWRPGKLRFLTGMKNPLPIRPAASTRQHSPLRAAPVARFVISVGPALLPSLIRRHFLILFVAQQKPASSRAIATVTVLAGLPVRASLR